MIDIILMIITTLSAKFEGNIGILWGIKNDGDLEVLLHQATQKEDIMILFYNAEFYNMLVYYIYYLYIFLICSKIK